MKIKRVLAMALCLITAIATMTACGKEDLLSNAGYVANYRELQTGDKIAVMTVKDYGEVKILLFPEYAPNAVENFIGLAEMDYYDELIFHRIIEGFMSQGGDPKGDGTGGNSIWGQDFALETSPYLYHVTGAVAYAHAQNGGNGSQFYIVNSQPGMTYGMEPVPMDKEIAEYYCPDNTAAQNAYIENGGMPFLDGGYTVFGQVIEGMDVIYALSAVETDEMDKPLKHVTIENVEIIEYTAE